MARVPVFVPLRWAVFGLLACTPRPDASTPAKAPAPSPRASPEPADLLVTDGRIYTVDEDNPWVEAVAIRDGRFLALGEQDDIMRHRGPNTRILDLDGAFALPGFNDNHVHFASAAAFLEFNVMKVSTQEAFADRLQRVTNELEAGEWIVGGYWGAYDAWTADSAGGRKREPFTPDMRAVAELTADHPVFIRKFDDSAFAANEAALRAVGIDADDPRAEGIEFARDPQGQWTGIMHGTGVKPLFEPAIPDEFSHQRRVSQTKHALAEIRAHGVTNISDMSDDEQLEIYRELRAEGALTVRVHFRPHLERWQELSDRGIAVGSGDPWIRLGAVKGHIDGIMGTSTARFFEPYAHQPENRGRWRRLMVDENGEFAEGKFLGYMLGADAAGLQLTVHAIGDQANHLLLNYLEQVIEKNGPKDRRFRLVHAQVIDPADMSRLGALDVVAEVQPFHLSDDMRWMEERIGKKRAEQAYAFRSIADSGAVLSFGTDWPGTSAAEYPIDPMLGLYAAVTRQTLSGQPPQGWFPEQRISIAEAIEAYTRGTAYANFEEDIKGTIEVGKLADMAVLSQNLLEIEPSKIPETNVLYTLVDGQIVYERGMP